MNPTVGIMGRTYFPQTENGEWREEPPITWVQVKGQLVVAFSDYLYNPQMVAKSQTPLSNFTFTFPSEEQISMWLGFRECQKRMALNNQGYPPGKGFFAHLEEVVTVKQCEWPVNARLGVKCSRQVEQLHPGASTNFHNQLISYFHHKTNSFLLWL